MKLVACIALLAVAALSATVMAADDSKIDCCDNWEPFFVPLTTGCDNCKKDEANGGDAEKINKCFIKAWYPLTGDDSLNIEEYSKLMTDWDNLKGSDERKNKLKNAISQCTTDGATTREQFNKVDECIYKAYRDNCPEAERKLQEQAKNEYFTACR